MSDIQPTSGAPTGDAAGEPHVVTRGKPPREHQFQKGRSGNPGGRPKGSRDFKTLLQRQLDSKVTATVEGRTVRITKRDAIAMRLVDKALKGDAKAIATCLQLDQLAASADASRLPPSDANPERDAAILAAYLERFKAGEPS